MGIENVDTGNVLATLCWLLGRISVLCAGEIEVRKASNDPLSSLSHLCQALICRNRRVVATRYYVVTT